MPWPVWFSRENFGPQNEGWSGFDSQSRGHVPGCRPDTGLDQGYARGNQPIDVCLELMFLFLTCFPFQSLKSEGGGKYPQVKINQKLQINYDLSSIFLAKIGKFY